MKPLVALFAFFALAIAIILPAPARAKEKADPLANEAIGKIKLGLPAAAVVKALGQPEKKGADTEEDATGEWVQNWEFPALGLKLSMSSGKKGGAKSVNSITATGACKLATARGIKIGSTEAEVRKAYGGVEDKEQSHKGESFVAGSIYGGVLFTLKDGKVSEIFLGAGAE